MQLYKMMLRIQLCIVQHSASPVSLQNLYKMLQELQMAKVRKVVPEELSSIFQVKELS